MPGDTFIEVSTTTALASHTPTGIDLGTGWTIEEQSGATGLRVNATTDRLEATGAGANARVIATLQPDPAKPDYDITFTIPSASTIATCPIFAIARYVDVNNYYGAGVYRVSDSPDCVIYKKVAGVVTLLASADTAIAAGDVLTFKVRDTSKKLFKNGTEILTTADNALTAAGKAGFAMGNCFVATDDIGTAWDVDTFSHEDAVETDAAAPFPVLRGILKTSNPSTSQLSVPLDWSGQSEQPMPGDLLMAFVQTSERHVSSWSAGWTQTLLRLAVSQDLAVRQKVFQDGDPATLEIEMLGDTGVIALVGFIRNASYAIKATIDGTGESTTPNPPSLTPAWGVANVLWVSVVCWAAVSASLNAAIASPANYTDLVYLTAEVLNGTSMGIGIATRQLRATTEDPGTFTLTTSAPWIGATIAIPTDGERVEPPNAGEDLSMMVRTVVDGISGLVKRLEITNDSGRSITVVLAGNSTSHSETVATGAAADVDVLALAIPNAAHSVTIT